MSRFSRAEAEARGWVFVHERDEYTTVQNSTHGRVQNNPANLRAEKYVSLPGQAASLVNEQAESEGLLLERIAAYEAHLERVSPQPEPARFVSDDLRTISLVDDAEGVGEEVRTVIVSADPEDLSLDGEVRYLTEAEWAARDKADVLVVRDEESGEAKQVVYSGPTEDAQTGLDAKAARETAVENARAAEEEFDGKQVVLDPADVTPDSPATTGTGILRIREDEELGDVAERHEQEGADREDERVQGQVEGGFVKHVPEEEAALAGVDVGLQRESDLASDIPPVGAIEGSTEFTGGEEADVSGPTAEAAAEERQAMEDAIQEEAQGADSMADATSAEGEADALEAGLDAAKEQGEQHAEDVADEQDQTADEDESSDEAPEDEEDAPGDDINATPAALKLAGQRGVSLEGVKGSGKDGRIVASDVPQADSE